jgi:hypothetical protein
MSARNLSVSTRVFEPVVEEREVILAPANDA